MSAFFPSYRERAGYPPTPSFRSQGGATGAAQRARRYRGEQGAAAAASDSASTPAWTAAHQERVALSRTTAPTAAEPDREALGDAERKLERELRWNRVSMRIGLCFGVTALAAALYAPGPLGRWLFLLGAAAELVFVPCYGAAARRRLGRTLAAVRRQGSMTLARQSLQMDWRRHA